MAYSTIPKGNLYMDTVLYTGNGSTQNITGVGFKPDWVWVKQRGGTTNHKASDIVRGVTKALQPNDADAEATDSNGITAFNSNGFSLGNGGDYNGNSNTQVAWNWLAGNSQGSSNTAGSINTTYTSVNTTAGFSISTYTGTGSNATIGHGLGVAPAMILTKATSFSEEWLVYHQSMGNTRAINLNLNNASSSSTTYWQNTTPGSSFFYVGSNDKVNKSGATYVAYAFAQKQGYSRMGAYMGNGSTGSSGTGTSFIHCGFSPSYVLIKNGQQSNEWMIFDNKRQGFNPENEALTANLSAAERTTNYLNFFSNGFSLSNTDGEVNSAGVPYIFTAFAENPFVATSGSTAVPVTAR